MEGTEWQGKRGIRVTFGRQEAHGAADELRWELGCSVLDWAQPGYCREWILQAPFKCGSVGIAGQWLPVVSGQREDFRPPFKVALELLFLPLGQV